MSTTEAQANAAIAAALRALQDAMAAAAEAGYGSQIAAPLDAAIRETRYALDTAEGRN